ncbi:MAG: hypothetical protein IJ744_05360 [Lachnospiraceae bacterium]|nr:hypothetical protein [Lachnospiraceae bacterium]
MAIYFVDYENVGSAGVDGVDYLTDQDEIKIFYSNHADTLKYEQVKQLLATKAKVDLLKIETGTANALDFQLVAMLYYTLKDDEPRYIISRDTGYDMAVKMGEQLGAAGIVKRCISVKKALNDRARAEQAKKAETKQAEAKVEAKKEPAKEERKVETPVKEEPKKAEPVKEEVKREMPVKEEPKKETPKKEVLKQEEPKKEAPKQEEPKKEVPKQEEPKKDLKKEDTKKETATHTPAKKPAFTARQVEGPGKAQATGVLDGYQFVQEKKDATSVLGERARAVLGKGPVIQVKTMEGGKEVEPAKEAKKPEKAQKAERTEKPEKTEKPVKAEKSEHTEKRAKTEKADKSEKADKTEKTEKMKKSEKVDQQEKHEKPEKSKPKKKSEKAPKAETKQDEEYLGKLRFIADDVQRHTGTRLNLSQCEMVLDALIASEGKDDFYHYFQQQLGNKKGQVFYQQIRSRFRFLKDKLAPWQPPVEMSKEELEEIISEPEMISKEEPSEMKEEPVTTEPEEETVKAEPSKTEPIKEEPIKIEPIKEEPVKEAPVEKKEEPAGPVTSEKKSVSEQKDNSILGRLGRLLGNR